MKPEDQDMQDNESVKQDQDQDQDMQDETKKILVEDDKKVSDLFPLT